MEMSAAIERATEMLKSIETETPLEFDSRGLCALSAEGTPDIVLSVFDEVDEIIVSSPLLEIREGELASFAVQLLRLNLYQIATRGSVLAYDPVAGAVVLNQSIPLMGDGGDLGALLTDFAETATDLAAAIATMREEAAQPAPTDTAHTIISA